MDELLFFLQKYCHICSQILLINQFFESEFSWVSLRSGSGPTKQNLEDTDVMNSIQFIMHHLKNAFDPVDVPLFPVFGRFDSVPLGVKPFPFLTYWCSELAFGKQLWREWIEAAARTVSAESDLPMPAFIQGEVVKNTLIFHQIYPIRKMH